MAEEKILLEGKTYISSGRAAKLVGYTKDYVGQLAREGKIEAKRIGRNWYIEESSINRHKLSVHYTLTKPKKKKETIDEISSKNIVKSVERNNSYDAKIKKFDNEFCNYDVKDEVDSEITDLFPRLKKSGRDPLLHSEIRYESGDYSIEKRTSAQTSNAVSYKTVPIRKPSRKINTIQSDSGKNTDIQRQKSAHTKFFIQGRHVDGIIVTRTMDSIRHQHTRPSGNVGDGDVQQRDDEFKKSQDQTVPLENSKVIPILGAILLFTIFTVTYIFLHAGA